MRMEAGIIIWLLKLMKKIYYIGLLIITAVAIGGIVIWRRGSHNNEKSVDLESKIKGMMTLTSPAFPEGLMIPAKYTCDGDNMSPPLKFSGVAPAAKSLALIVDDPDAPLGTWVHWLVWNIDPKTQSLEDGQIPIGAILGKTSFGKSGYGGPCPPLGAHRYQFKLYALDTVLDLTHGADKSELEAAIKGHIIENASLTGRYNRGKN